MDYPKFNISNQKEESIGIQKGYKDKPILTMWLLLLPFSVRTVCKDRIISTFFILVPGQVNINF